LSRPRPTILRGFASLVGRGDAEPRTGSAMMCPVRVWRRAGPCRSTPGARPNLHAIYVNASLNQPKGAYVAEPIYYCFGSHPLKMTKVSVPQALHRMNAQKHPCPRWRGVRACLPRFTAGGTSHEAGIAVAGSMTAIETGPAPTCFCSDAADRI